MLHSIEDKNTISNHQFDFRQSDLSIYKLHVITGTIEKSLEEKTEFQLLPKQFPQFITILYFRSSF